jgi:hypothetical protein
MQVNKALILSAHDVKLGPVEWNVKIPNVVSEVTNAVLKI